MVIHDSRRDWATFDRVRRTVAAMEMEESTTESFPINTASWMNKPISSDSSWTPVAPPSQKTSTKRGRRVDSKPRPDSPTAALLAPPLNRSRSRRDYMENLSASKRSSGSNASLRSHEEYSGRRSNETREQSASNVSRGLTVDASHHNSLREPSIDQLGRGRSERRASNRSRSQSRASNRGRSQSKTRSSSTKRPSRSLSQPHSTSGTSKRRGRSTSRPRPPVTMNNRNRTRSRSTSLTRVTSPTSHARKSTRSKSSNRRPPPSTSRTRLEKKKGNGANSIGPGIRNRSAYSDDGSTTTFDTNIGRDISFGREHSSSDSVKSEKAKKEGLLVKLFGDQVEKQGAFLTRSGGCSSRPPIRPRVLLAATVYHNIATNLWITTINTNQRGVAKNPTTANRYLKAFSFSTEREARESAIANAPPKMVAFTECPSCFICSGKFAVFRRAAHCRNCGVCICNSCSVSWPAKMIPETYNLKSEATVRVCRSCEALNLAFKKALLDGDYEEAVAIYGTGNVNLRTPFATLNKKDEVMHPIHCAVAGGNLDIVRWLIDDHFCPIKLVISSGRKSKRGGGTDVQILTSRARSVLSIAVEYAHVDIMRYLVVECGLSIYRVKDLKHSLRALEASLTRLSPTASSRHGYEPVTARWDNASFDDASEPSSLGDEEPLLDESGTVGSTQRTKKSTSETCIICFDRKIDCVATPCGHQICCLECSTNLSACPVCNNQGDFIKIFRP